MTDQVQPENAEPIYTNTVNAKPALIIFGAIAIVGVGVWWFEPGRAGLRDCEAALQRQLRSPATYQRVSWETWGGQKFSPTYYRIEYDADNAFGVPIRDEVTCYTDGNGYASVEDLSLTGSGL